MSEKVCEGCGGRLAFYDLEHNIPKCYDCRYPKPVKKEKIFIEQHEPDTAEDRQARYERMRAEVADKIIKAGLSIKEEQYRNTNYDFVLSNGLRLKLYANWDLSRGEVRRQLTKGEIFGKRDICVIGRISNDEDKESVYWLVPAEEFVRLSELHDESSASHFTPSSEYLDNWKVLASSQTLLDSLKSLDALGLRYQFKYIK